MHMKILHLIQVEYFLAVPITEINVQSKGEVNFKHDHPPILWERIQLHNRDATCLKLSIDISIVMGSIETFWYVYGPSESV